MHGRFYRPAFLLSALLPFHPALAAPPLVTATENADSVGKYHVYEVTLAHTGVYANPWENVDVVARFASPSGRIDTISGFYYDADTWKVRFAPTEPGKWTWTLAFSNTETTTLTGDLVCVASTRRGFLRPHPKNPFRIVYADGSLFGGSGLGDCVYIGSQNGIPTEPLLWTMDWTSSRSTTTFFQAFGSPGARFNMFRWSTNNCSFNLGAQISTAGNTYLNLEGKSLDLLCDSLQQYGLAVWIGLFGYNPPYLNSAGNPAEENAVKRYLRYMVARYGAYADVWEIANETVCPNAFVDYTSAYVKSIDPYDRMFTANSVDQGGWQTPDLPSVDINTPHLYELTSDVASVAAVAADIEKRRAIRKPIIYGEKGWSGHNWDATCEMRMRLEDWTAFFNEAEFLWWVQSGGKTYKSGAGNAYIGLAAHLYARVFHDFIRNTDPDVIRYPIVPSNPDIEAFGLRSGTSLLAYLHNKTSHSVAAATGLTVDVPAAGPGFWLDPATGDTLGRFTAAAGSQVLTSPSFTIDVALKISSASGPNPNRPIQARGIPARGIRRAGNTLIIPLDTRGPSRSAFISIRNRLGRQVAALYSGPSDGKSGEVAVRLPSLPVGLYFVVIDAGGRRDTAGLAIAPASR